MWYIPVHTGIYPHIPVKKRNSLPSGVGRFHLYLSRDYNQTENFCKKNTSSDYVNPHLEKTGRGSQQTGFRVATEKLLKDQPAPALVPMKKRKKKDTPIPSPVVPLTRTQGDHFPPALVPVPVVMCQQTATDRGSVSTGFSASTSYQQANPIGINGHRL